MHHTRSKRSRTLTALTAALVLGGSILAATGAQAAEPTPHTEPITLSRGHVDAFNVAPKADGSGAELLLKEDVTALDTYRTPESVILQVTKDAFYEDVSNFPIPQEVRDARSVYVLPQNQDLRLLWPGWNTQALANTYGSQTATDIVVENVRGPGKIFMWISAGFGGFESRLAGGGYTLPGTIQQPYPAHTHVYWAFSKPGTYKLQVHAEGKGADGTVNSPQPNGKTFKTSTRTYTFVVDAPTTVTPIAPTQEGNMVTVPSTTGVSYTDAAGETLSAGEHELTAEMTVKAKAEYGYVLDAAATNEWKFSYVAPAPPAEGETPAPVPSEPAPADPQPEDPKQAGPQPENPGQPKPSTPTGNNTAAPTAAAANPAHNTPVTATSNTKQLALTGGTWQPLATAAFALLLGGSILITRRLRES